MKDPVKGYFKRILILTSIFVAVGVIACLIAINYAYWESLHSGIQSSLVNSETVAVMIGLACAGIMFLTLLIICILVIARPLFVRARMKRKEQKKSRRPASRFSALANLDRELRDKKEAPFDDRPLDVLCHDFRNYAAGKLGLYYQIDDIRRFVAGMGISKLMILRGISGTGKTSLAYAAGEFFGNPSTIVPIQPMWKERSDILGYFNEFTRKFNETKLLIKLYEAGDRKSVYITVLDEVNIARIEYYFAEFLSLLEIPDPQKRKLDVVSDAWSSDPERLCDGRLILPDNMWFIGTANNDDSTFAISDKVYDRASVIDLDRKCKPFKAEAKEPVHISYEQLQQHFQDAKKKYSLSAEKLTALEKLDNFLSDTFRVSFGNRIMHQIECYVPIMLDCGGCEVGALDDILSRKVFRKLEQLSPVLLRNEMHNLLALLDESFGEDSLPQCREYLARLMRSA